MTERRLEPLDEELHDLLAAERDRPDLPDPARARIAGRLAATLGPLGSVGSGIRPTAPQPAAAAPASTSIIGAPLGLGLLAGGVVAALIATRAPAPAPSVEAPPAAIASVSAAVSAVLAAPPPAASAAVAPPPSARPSASARDESLAAERAVLDRAQRAVAAGRSDEALAEVARHAAEFPRGRLSEEREGLWIQALLAAGRADEARARAARFKRAHPRSLLLPALESTLGPIP
jgi:hypothetical protein